MNVSTHTAVSNLESEPGVSMGDVSTSGMTRSQMSVGQAGSSTTLSMREKAARKRRINAQHNSNFRAGYVPVEEEALHRTGIRGRKRYFLYCVVIVLMITAVLNTMMTAWLLYILGLGYHGMVSIELTTVVGREFLRVLADAQIINMTFSDAPLGARYNSSLVLVARESVLKIESTNGSCLKLEGSDITVTTDKFAVSVGDNQTVLANLPSLAAHRTINNLFVDNVTTSLIQEMKAVDDLYMESQHSISISAGQEVEISSKKTLEISAFNIHMQAQNSVTMDTKHGIYLKKLPQVRARQSGSNSPSVPTYKICVCQSGRLFTVPATGPGVSCDIGPQLHTVCGDTA